MASASVAVIAAIALNKPGADWDVDVDTVLGELSVVGTDEVVALLE